MASNKSCSILVITKMVLMLVMVLMVFTPILVNAFSNLYGHDSTNQAEQYNAGSCPTINAPRLNNAYHAGGCPTINAPRLNNAISGTCVNNAPTLNNAISNSWMTVWAGPGCNNLAERYDVCGCTDINLHGGYYFYFGGQTGAMYNLPGCRGYSHSLFRSDATQCTSIGWMSIFIQC